VKRELGLHIHMCIVTVYVHKESVYAHFSTLTHQYASAYS